MIENFRCKTCAKDHDGKFNFRWCSESCRLVYWMRVKLGLHVEPL